MFKQYLFVLRFKDAHSSNYNIFQEGSCLHQRVLFPKYGKDAHSSNYNIFQEGSCLHQRVLFPKYGSLSWTNITLCIQKNDVQL